jgi:peptidyl-dipeptidase Dcp
MRHFKPTSSTGLILLALPFVCCCQTQPLSPTNPFYAPSPLPYHAPPFDRIKDSDYRPAIEAGIAEKMRELRAIADNPAPPDFTNTIVPLLKSGKLLDRSVAPFFCVVSAVSNPTLRKVEEVISPELAALNDSMHLDPKLFARIKAVYDKLPTLSLDSEAKHAVEVFYRDFSRAGANLDDNNKKRLKQINEQLSLLSAQFDHKLLAASEAAAFVTKNKKLLEGLSDGQIDAAALAAKNRNQPGYRLPLQNTVQQPLFASLADRETRASIYNNSWNRAERGGDTDTRQTLLKIANLRMEKARLLGYPNFASWMVADQMAKTPEAVLKFLDTLSTPASARAAAEAKDIQAVIDKQPHPFPLAAYDWDLYSEQVRKAKFDLDQNQIRPYLELNRVLQGGVFYAATKLYGITFRERKGIPVYHSDVRVFEVSDSNGKPFALFYADLFQRDNKQGGAWTSDLVSPSKLNGLLPVVFNVENLPKPAPGQPALISSDDVRVMFHEFGHALAEIFDSAVYEAGSTPRDFVEFPSQFNEHWADDPDVFAHYARHYKTNTVMPSELVAKIRRSRTFNQGYLTTEMVAASELDMQWHLLAPGAVPKGPDVFEKDALKKRGLWISVVPPRYRTSIFEHIWAGGYAAGYYGYLWSEMIDDDAYEWFTQHGGMTRSNGDHFRQMILSRGSSQDFETMYEHWRGGPPTTKGLLRERGLLPATDSQ